MTQSAAVLGLDIGGTKTLGMAFDADMNELVAHRVATARAGPEAVAAMAIDVVAAIAERLDGRPIASIGVGVPGVVDREQGSVRQAVNLGIGDRPLLLAERLSEAHSVACVVDNDVNVGAIGALRLLQASEDVTDLAYLSIGTGIAAGLVLNGRLHRGHRGVAGEIGHVPVAPDGPLCECGLRGCLEVMASGAAIDKLWTANDGASAAESLIRAAERGDVAASATLERVADHLAAAVYLVAVSYDVDRIVLGGGVSELGDLILDPIVEGIRRLEKQSGFARSLELPGRVVLKPAESVGALGAALLPSGER